MPKVSSSQSRYRVRRFQDSPLLDLKDNVLRRSHWRRWAGSGGWLLAGTAIAAMMYLNGRLVASTGVGAGVMLLLYLMRNWKPQLPLENLRQAMNTWNQPFVLAVLGGGAATLTTYLAASIWVESESHWIASGAILQGAGTLTVLVLLAWQILSRQAAQTQVNYNELLNELTQEDALRRLIAVRQLTSLVTDQPDNAIQQREVGDCFRLLLSREPEPIVREAVIEGLESLNLPNPSHQSNQPIMAADTTYRRSRRTRSPRTR